jgi:hypothetical protein
MASCDLSIELDEGKTRYQPGESVSGRVVVRTDSPVKCDGLDAKLEWFTHGKGNEDQEAVETERLFTGQWSGGETVAYPFRFTAPATPLSYAGEILNVDFRVRVTADIPWALDPKAEQTIEIAHDPPPDGLKVTWDPEKHKSDLKSCFGCSVALLPIGLAVVALAIVGEDVPIQIGVALVVFALIGFSMSTRRYLAERKLGTVKMEFEQITAAGYRGASKADQLKVVLMSRAGARINHATAMLAVREEVVRGSGTNKRTFRHDISATDTMLTQTAPGRCEGVIQLPLGAAPYSFYADSNELLWELSLHIDIPDSPDWKETVKLQAQPAR